MSDGCRHGLIWYLEDDPRLRPDAGRAFENCDAGRGVIHVPTVCLVEIVYLQQRAHPQGHEGPF